MRNRLLTLLLLCSCSLFAQRLNLSRQSVFTIVNVAQLPGSAPNGTPYLVQDSSDGSCTSGGGTIKVTCVRDGGAWVAYGGATDNVVDSVNGNVGDVVLDAGDIGSDAAGDVAATTVQAAIAELASEKLASADAASTYEPIIAANALGPADIDETANYVFQGTLFQTGAAPTTNAAGQLALDTNAWGASRGALQYFDGTSTVWLCGILSTDTPTDGQVAKWNSDGTCTWEDDNDAGVGSGDAVTVNGVSVDTTADFDDTATIELTLVDGGAGGPDQVRASIVAGSVGPTQLNLTGNFAPTGEWDFSGGTVILPSGTQFGSGTGPFGITGYTDDTPPSAPAGTNEFSIYVRRDTGLLCWILQTTGSELCADGSGGGGSGDIVGSNGGESFTTQTSVVIEHTFGHDRLITTCYNGSGAEVEAASKTIGSGPAYDVTVTFAIAQTGRCVVSGGGSAGYTWSLVAQTAPTLTAATHSMGSGAHIEACYDGSGNRVEPGSESRNGSGDLSPTFAVAFTGDCEVRP